MNAFGSSNCYQPSDARKLADILKEGLVSFKAERQCTGPEPKVSHGNIFKSCSRIPNSLMSNLSFGGSLAKMESGNSVEENLLYS